MKNPLDIIYNALNDVEDLNIRRSSYKSVFMPYRIMGESLIFTYKDEWLAICKYELNNGKYFLYYAVDDKIDEPAYRSGTSNDFISLMKNIIAQRYYIL